MKKNVITLKSTKIFIKKENQEAKIIASMVKHKVLTKLNINYVNNYLNVSIDNNLVEYALIALMVKHQSNKLDPNRILGSNPSQGVSTFKI